MFKLIAASPMLLLALVASADQRILLDSHLASDFVPVTITAPTSNGFWALGSSDGLTTLARYDASGVPQILRYPDMQSMSYAQSFTLVPKADGGVMSTDIEDVGSGGSQTCAFRSFDPSGNYLWTSDLAQSGGVMVGPAICSNVYPDGAGNIWLYPAGVNEQYLIAANQDGTSGPQFARPDVFSTRAAPDPTAEGIYIAGATGTDSSSALATVWKFTSQGQQWAVSAPATDQGSVLHDVVVAADGSIWAFGSHGTLLYGMHVTANGTLLWSGSFSTSQNPSDVRVVARADGGVSTLHWDTTAVAPEVSTFSSAGSQLWHVASGLSLTSDQTLSQLNLVAAADGDVVAAVMYLQSGALYLQQARLDDAGSVLFKNPPQAQPPRPYRNSFSLVMYPDDSSLTAAGSFEHLARNGVASTAPMTSAITRSTSLDASGLLGPDGSAYTVAINADSKLLGVSAYSNAGALRWHAVIPSSWSEGGLQGFAQLLLRSSDVCVATDLDGSEIVQCFALVDGTPTVNQILGPAPPQGGDTQGKVTSSGEIVLLYIAADGTTHHVLIDASGSLLHNVAPLMSGEAWLSSSQNSAGDTVIVTSSTTLLKLAADGSRTYSVPIDAPVRSATLSNDGTAFLVQSGSPPTLERVDASGNRLWQSTMPTGPYAQITSMRFTANELYCTVIGTNIIYGGGDLHPEMQGLIEKIALADGAIQWATPISYLFGNNPRLVVSPDEQDVLLFSGWLTQTQIRDYGTSDGTLLGGKFDPCGVDLCGLFDAIQAPDGTLRMLHDTTDYVSGSQFQMTIMQKEFDKIFADGFGN
jgi:hypothetical protein